MCRICAYSTVLSRSLLTLKEAVGGRLPIPYANVNCPTLAVGLAVTVSCGLSTLLIGDRDHLGKIEANRQLNACLCKRSRFP